MDWAQRATDESVKLTSTPLIYGILAILQAIKQDFFDFFDFFSSSVQFFTAVVGGCLYLIYKAAEKSPCPALSSLADLLSKRHIRRLEVTEVTKNAEKVKKNQKKRIFFNFFLLDLL